jgi:hypothetical protein
VTSTDATADSIRQGHLARGWVDIGYHWLVDVRGQVHKGRSENLAGAHCPSLNRSHLGVALIGDFRQAEVPEVMLVAAVSLYDRLCQAHGRLEVKGHRECQATLCPGDMGMAVVHALRRMSEQGGL